MTARLPLALLALVALAPIAQAQTADGTCPAQPGSLETFASDVAAADGAPLRDPASAVTFVRGLEHSLGFSGSALDARRKHETADTATFFAANPDLFSKDLRGAYRPYASLTARPAPQITIAGDAHLGNFGTFRGPDGDAVYGVNDFDGAHRGSPETDLERLATSAVIAARAEGLSRDEQAALVKDLATKYFDTISALASHSDAAFLSKSDAHGAIRNLVDAASGEKRKDFLDALLKGDGNEHHPRFRNDAELESVDHGQEKAIEDALPGWKVLDVAKKLGSGGSTFGLDRWYALVENPDDSKRPLVLELKAGLTDPGATVGNQETLGGLVNPITAAVRVDGTKMLLRELEPEKSRLDVKSGKDLRDEVAADAEALARAHAAKHGNGQAIDRWIAGDRETATTRLIDFASAYANQAEADRRAIR